MPGNFSLFVFGIFTATQVALVVMVGLSGLLSGHVAAFLTAMGIGFVTHWAFVRISRVQGKSGKR